MLGKPLGSGRVTAPEPDPEPGEEEEFGGGAGTLLEPAGSALYGVGVPVG